MSFLSLEKKKKKLGLMQLFDSTLSICMKEQASRVPVYSGETTEFHYHSPENRFYFLGLQNHC